MFGVRGFGLSLGFIVPFLETLSVLRRHLFSRFWMAKSWEEKRGWISLASFLFCRKGLFRRALAVSWRDSAVVLLEVEELNGSRGKLLREGGPCRP